jgi:hypothetical protein
VPKRVKPNQQGPNLAVGRRVTSLEADLLYERALREMGGANEFFRPAGGESVSVVEREVPGRARNVG